MRLIAGVIVGTLAFVVGVPGCGKELDPAPESALRSNAPPTPTPESVWRKNAPPGLTPEPDPDAPPPEAWTLSTPLVVPAPTATTGGCIPGLLEYHQMFTYAHLEGRTLELCRGVDADGGLECFRLDLDTNALTKAKPSPAIKAQASGRPRAWPKELKVAKDGKHAEVCVGKCVPLDLKGLFIGQAGVSGDLVFVGPGFDAADLPEEARAIRVYDATTGAELSSHTHASLESECPLAHWAGRTLYVEAGVCAGPGAVGRFFDPAGKPLGLLGGGVNSASAYGVVPVPVGGGLVAFREQYGHAIFFHDGKTARVERRMNLVDTLAKTEYGDADLAPEEGWMFGATRADGRTELVVVQGGMSRDRVLVVDPEAVAITRFIQLRACAAAP